MSRLIRAAQFAAKAHAGQARKYPGPGGPHPYIEHPMRVAGQVMLCAGVQEDTVIAAWLHDVIEDCGVSIEEIRDVFGEGVSALVGWCTNPSKGSALPRQERKKIDRDHLVGAPADAHLIKCVDRADNLRELLLADGQATGSFVNIYGYESMLLADVLILAPEELRDGLYTLAKRCVNRGVP